MSPRHSLNGGGPISAQAVLDGDSWSNGSRAYEHTLLRNYQRVSLVAEDSVSCIVGALLRDGIAFEIHERRVSTLRVRAPAEGMRAATLILRIPGSAFIAVSGLLEGRLLDYALRLRGSGGSSASGGDALVDELSDRWGADEAAKCSAQTKTRRFALDQLELASTRPNLTAATIQRVLLPRVDPSRQLAQDAAIPMQHSASASGSSGTTTASWSLARGTRKTPSGCACSNAT